MHHTSHWRSLRERCRICDFPVSATICIVDKIRIVRHMHHLPGLWHKFLEYIVVNREVKSHMCYHTTQIDQTFATQIVTVT